MDTLESITNTQTLDIDGQFAIPMEELTFQSAQSGGPGGQHVNKTESKIILRFNIVQSPNIPEDLRSRLLAQLEHRLTKQGELVISAHSSRSQKQNKEDAIARFVSVLTEALHQDKPRKPTRPSRGVRERRLRDKRQQGERKQLRRWKEED